MSSTNSDEQMCVPDSQDSDINILLLGETGVGKSTFINSFVNFLQHTTFSNAMNSELACLIPIRFTIPNEDYEEMVIEFGSDQNEDTKIGNSSTQGSRGYLFPFEDYNIRLIDTPGIGDARGIQKDGENFENVLSYISQYKHLHGICFLLKPNVSVINAYFKFCIMHLISRLEKSAVNNIIFIFTNSRNTFYRPGETLPILKRVLNEIKQLPPYVEVPCSKKNMFCVDNEAFKFLIAKKHGIKFDETETKEFAKSWETSYKTCKGILSYICGDKKNEALKPHDIKNTISVNEARRTIIDLSKPLADISDCILDNLTQLEKQAKLLQQANLSQKDLVSNLYVPQFQLQITNLVKPMTVCTSPKCSEVYYCGGLLKYRYKQICHRPCHLSNIPNEIIGAQELLNCLAFKGSVCKECECYYSHHMHMHYESEMVQTMQENVTVKNQIQNKQDEIKAKNSMVVKLKKEIAAYGHEIEEISKCMAKFGHFLKENSISAYDDNYLNYLNYLISREKSLGEQKNEARVKHYTSLRSRYEEEKTKLGASENGQVVAVSEIPDLIQFLYNLPLTGSQISKLHSMQQQSIQNSFHAQEYKYPKLMKSFGSENDSSDEDEEIPSTKPASKPDKGLKRINLDKDVLRTKLKSDSLKQMELKLIEGDEIPKSTLTSLSVPNKELKQTQLKHIDEVELIPRTELKPALSKQMEMKCTDKDEEIRRTELRSVSIPDKRSMQMGLKYIDEKEIPKSTLTSPSVPNKELKQTQLKRIDEVELIPRTELKPALSKQMEIKCTDKDEEIRRTELRSVSIPDKRSMQMGLKYIDEKEIPKSTLISASMPNKELKQTQLKRIDEVELIPRTELKPALSKQMEMKCTDKDEEIRRTELRSVSIPDKRSMQMGLKYIDEKEIPKSTLISASMSNEKLTETQLKHIDKKVEVIPRTEIKRALMLDTQSKQMEIKCTDKDEDIRRTELRSVSMPDKRSMQMGLKYIDEKEIPKSTLISPSMPNKELTETQLKRTDKDEGIPSIHKIPSSIPVRQEELKRNDKDKPSTSYFSSIKGYIFKPFTSQKKENSTGSPQENAAKEDQLNSKKSHRKPDKDNPSTKKTKGWRY